MSGIIEYILIFITLTVVITGVILDTSNTQKIVLVLMAVLSSIGMIFKTIFVRKESDINKKLIATLIGSSNKPEYFAHDLVKALNQVLEEKNKQVVTHSIYGSDEHVLTLKSKINKNIDGVIYFSQKSMRQIYYSYAIDEDICIPLEKLINNKWTDCEKHWNECFYELGAISRQALKEMGINTNNTSPSMNSDKLIFTLNTNAKIKQLSVKVILERDFIESLYGLSKLDRGYKIFEKSKSCINNILESNPCN